MFLPTVTKLSVSFLRFRAPLQLELELLPSHWTSFFITPDRLDFFVETNYR
jgi:hypothetical protein